mmetsp:Transcript_5017/g.14215  ORF Transcript_5017/g.14215 Transcript_5017/m.14215 type:complete len:208 (+) Transcript_5017:141-764(+)
MRFPWCTMFTRIWISSSRWASVALMPCSCFFSRSASSSLTPPPCPCAPFPLSALSWLALRFSRASARDSSTMFFRMAKASWMRVTVRRPSLSCTSGSPSSTYSTQASRSASSCASDKTSSSPDSPCRYCTCSRSACTSPLRRRMTTAGSVSSLMCASLRIMETRCAKRAVLMVSSVCSASGFTVATMMVLQLPPSESRSTEVIMELR